MIYHRPPSDLTNPDKLRHDAAARRRVLRQASLTTYTIGRRDSEPAIICLCCGLNSTNENDILNHYCGFCKAYHDDVPSKQG